MAQQNKEQGKVLVQIVIGKDGNVSNIKILEGASAWLDAEAIRVVRGMPKWEPGKQNGQAVAVEYTFLLHSDFNKQNRKYHYSPNK